MSNSSHGPAPYRYRNLQYVPEPGRETETRRAIFRRAALFIGVVVASLALTVSGWAAAILGGVLGLSHIASTATLLAGVGCICALIWLGIEKFDSEYVLFRTLGAYEVPEGYFIDWDRASVPNIHAGLDLLAQTRVIESSPVVATCESHLTESALARRTALLARADAIRAHALGLLDGSITDPHYSDRA